MPGRRAAALCVVGVLAASLPPAPRARAGSIWVPGSEGVVNVPATTVSERKFSKVVKQRYDFSCGSAALATLLTFHYDDPTDETDTFRYMYDHGDRARIAQAGFSLLDMKGYLSSRGYESDGYEPTLPVLANAGVPAIALINYRGYRHFVIVKGVRNNHVLLGDPALGTRLVASHEFERLWDNGVLFIIKNKPEVGRRHFNTEAQWQGLAVAPLGTALAPQDLASLTVNLPRLGEF